VRRTTAAGAKGIVLRPTLFKRPLKFCLYYFHYFHTKSNLYFASFQHFYCNTYDRSTTSLGFPTNIAFLRLLEADVHLHAVLIVRVSTQHVHALLADVAAVPVCCSLDGLLADAAQRPRIHLQQLLLDCFHFAKIFAGITSRLLWALKSHIHMVLLKNMYLWIGDELVARRVQRPARLLMWLCRHFRGGSTSTVPAVTQRCCHVQIERLQRRFHLFHLQNSSVALFTHLYLPVEV
jgi:hypothetical protein